MPFTVAAGLSATFFGRSYNVDQGVTVEQGWPISPSVGPAWAGTLTTRTDDDTGTVTMDDADHEVSTADKVDIYWDGGYRRNVTVGTVATTSVPIDGGSGDVLPADETAVVVAVHHPEGTIAVDGDLVKAIAFNAPAYACVFRVLDDAGAELLAVPLDANGAYLWTSESGVTNPLAGADVIASVTCTHASVSETIAMDGAIGWD